MCPEKHHTEEGEVDGDAVDKGAENGWRADVLRGGVGGELAAGLDEVLVLGTVWDLGVGVGGQVAVRLWAKSSVLRCDDHGDGVVDAEGNQGKQNSSHEESLRRGVAFADLEYGEPEEADACGGNAHDRGGEEEEHKKQEQDVVDGEDLGGLDEDPVDRLEDVDVAEDVAAVGAANGVLGLVDARDEHAGEGEEGDDDE